MNFDQNSALSWFLPYKRDAICAIESGGEVENHRKCENLACHPSSMFNERDALSVELKSQFKSGIPVKFDEMKFNFKVMSG